MQLDDAVPVLEAVLFAGGEAVEGTLLAEIAQIREDMIPSLIQRLNDRYEKEHSALMILRLEKSYQMATRNEYAEYIQKIFENKRLQPLSAAAMEALTIVAYNQPVSKGFVEHVRGVDSASVVNSLVEKGLLEEAGRLDVPGRPIAYRTTDIFLRCFQLSSLAELPPLPNHREQISFDEILLEENSFSGDVNEEESSNEIKQEDVM